MLARFARSSLTPFALVLGLAAAALCAEVGLASAGSAARRAAVHAPSRCEVSGSVTGLQAKPLVAVHVQLRDASHRVIADGATDATGKYRFAVPVGPANVRGARVSLFAAEWRGAATPGRFEILYHDKPAQLQSAPLSPAEASAGCAVRNFAIAGVTLPVGSRAVAPRTAAFWGDVASIYAQTVRAANYATNVLGVRLDYGAPLAIRAWCDEAGGPCQDPTDSFFVGSSSGGLRARFPFIALGSQVAGSASAGGDESLYHEIGHAVMANGFGDMLPGVDRHDSNHGGYYRNASSSDAFVEGFATYFASIIADTDPTIARTDLVNWQGWALPLEADRLTKAWDYANAGEELAVAGALRDLVDDDRTYRAGPVITSAVTHMTVARGPSGAVVSGSVTNVDPGRAMTVRVTALGRSGRPAFSSTVSTTLASAGRHQFLTPVPAGIRFARVTVEAHYGRVDSERDDDPVALTPRQVWDAIVGYRRRAAHPTTPSLTEFSHAADVADMYAALEHAFAGDRNHDGVDDIEEIFIQHGLFADLDGNRRYSPNEVVGLTSHPALLDAHGDVISNAMVPRFAMSAPAVMRAQLDGALVPLTIHVFVRYPSHPQNDYDYAAQTDATRHFVIAVPPADSGANVVLCAIPVTGRPLVIDTIHAATFWATAQLNHNRHFVHYTVSSPTSGLVNRSHDRSSAPVRAVVIRRDPPASTKTKAVRLPSVKTIALILAALAVLIAAIRRRRHHHH